MSADRCVGRLIVRDSIVVRGRRATERADDRGRRSQRLGRLPRRQSAGKTPNIDRLAEAWNALHPFYCAAPVCNPSRAGLLTGKRPSTSGVYYNSHPWRPALPTSSRCRNTSWRTAITPPAAERFFTARSPRMPRGTNTTVKSRIRTRRRDPGIRDESRRRNHLGRARRRRQRINDHKIVDWAIEQLKKKHDKPLFLACGLFKPHMPWQVPRKYYDMFPLESIELPKVLETDLDDVPRSRPADGEAERRPRRDPPTATGNARCRRISRR